MAEDTSNKTKTAEQNGTNDSDLEQVKIMAALAYVGILFFLPLVTHPSSTFGKFHANQGLLLFITGLVVNTLGTFIPIIGWFIILPLGWIFVFVLFIMGIVNALNKKMTRLPLIGSIDLIK